MNKPIASTSHTLAALVASAALATSACGAPPDDAASDEAAITGLAVGANPFSFGVVKLVSGSNTYTGTLVASDWVLTTRYLAGSPLGSLTASMRNTSAGTTQTSGVRQLIAHPTLDVALVQLSTPMTAANRSYYPHLLAAAPANNASLSCYGYGAAGGGALLNAPFAVSNSGNSFALTGWQRALEAGDLGGPCFTGTLDANGVQQIGGIVSRAGSSATGLSGVGVTGGGQQDSIDQWVADMIHLAQVRAGQYAYSVHNRYSGKLMEVAGASLLPTAAVNQFRAISSALNQQWYYEYTSYPWMRLVSAQSGKCLDVNASNQLMQQTCSGATTQLFRLLYIDNTYARVYSRAGRCVDDPGFSTGDGVRLQTYPCNGGTNQQWYFGIH